MFVVNQAQNKYQDKDKKTRNVDEENNFCSIQVCSSNDE